MGKTAHYLARLPHDMIRGVKSIWAAHDLRDVLVDQDIKIISFDHWQPELDEALSCLPEADLFPHELFRTLMMMAEPKKRRILLITKRGVPIGLVGLRNRRGYWEPVTHWIVPGVLFPIQEGCLECILTEVLPSLGIEIQIGWWRWEMPPPLNKYAWGLSSSPTFQMHLSEDVEEYWRSTRNMKNIRQYRNRCRQFTLEVNKPGDAEWVLKNNEEKLLPAGLAEIPDLAEKIAVSRYLEDRNLYYTLSLRDGDRRVAGATLIKHGNDAVAHTFYRDHQYNWHGVGTRLVELSFHWAKEMGFRRMDVGGSFEYKHKWAPEEGRKWAFEICPWPLYVKNWILRMGRRGWDRISHRASSAV